ncbi:hypothetical protein BDV96DRAFT_645720 [Lophiotrema nucula]|uniref:Uncharacterized protein n=1 Tax=Lophiotrema nucula TaxID=690887 RepID=A0A6A5ZAZ3_9PLEO|nr:hypothetical protein BDV96DRAFT_645720 [Lophiotrema nucula]
MYTLFAFGLAALGVRTVLAQDDDTPNPCVSYGMDFQNGGSYFQNSNSNDNFTFVSEFDGCQADFAYNILIDPAGDQWECSNTNLTPDGADMLSSCPLLKSQLSSGPWSVVIISNNGDAQPIAYERDFDLSVGPQSTVTYTPTVSSTLVIVPVVSSTSTKTDTLTTVLTAQTVTVPSTTITPTTTVIPARVTTTTTKALVTLKFTEIKIDIQKATQTKTASCKLPHRQATHDPTATIQLTVGPTITGVSAKFRREVADIEANNRRWASERRARWELEKRAPDAQPLTVTDSNTADWATVTVTSTGPATTVTIPTQVSTTATSTPPPVTVASGKATAKVVTTTAPAPTRTITKYNIATSVTTKTLKYVFNITKTTTPAAVATACKKAGGILY